MWDTMYRLELQHNFIVGIMKPQCSVWHQRERGGESSLLGREGGHDIMSGSLSATGRGVDRWGPIATTSKCPISGIIRALCLPDIVWDNNDIMKDPKCLQTYLPDNPMRDRLNFSPVNS